MPLTQAEITACREAFSRFDKDGAGSIDAAKLKAMLASLGQTPSDEEIFIMISQVDEDNSGACVRARRGRPRRCVTLTGPT